MAEIMAINEINRNRFIFRFFPTQRQHHGMDFAYEWHFTPNMAIKTEEKKNGTVLFDSNGEDYRKQYKLMNTVSNALFWLNQHVGSMMAKIITYSFVKQPSRDWDDKGQLYSFALSLSYALAITIWTYYSWFLVNPLLCLETVQTFDGSAYWLLLDSSLLCMSSQATKSVGKESNFLSISYVIHSPLPIQKVTACSRHPTKSFTWWVQLDQFCINCNVRISIDLQKQCYSEISSLFLSFFSFSLF
ncbi:hypothetical protein VNO80_10972 [Phaseolus coccineus]|uniref:Uncharacterized protein n=1 Tax=Phaseolus coccineus TaxID=3886 RepID=A0AAN9N972_PHACN